MKFIFFLLVFFYSCDYQGAGTLGGFEPVQLNRNFKELKQEINVFFEKNPKYQVPEKWKIYDNWNQRGYGFLNGFVFYFEEGPEEMYYTTFLGDSLTLEKSTSTSISVRAIHRGTGKWLKVDDIDEKEKQRIENRFTTEIISKL